jgi:hypothetical protein
VGAGGIEHYEVVALGMTWSRLEATRGIVLPAGEQTIRVVCLRGCPEGQTTREQTVQVAADEIGKALFKFE